MIQIERYLLRTATTACLSGLVVLTGVVWVTQALRQIDLITSKGQTILLFLLITALALPSLVAFIAPVAGADKSGGLPRSSISRRDWATHLSRFGSNIADGSRSSCNERAHGASAAPGRRALMRARRISGRRGRDDPD